MTTLVDLHRSLDRTTEIQRETNNFQLALIDRHDRLDQAIQTLVTSTKSALAHMKAPKKEVMQEEPVQLFDLTDRYDAL